MSQLASFTAADGQATPVTHTFTPVALRDGVAKWSDKASGIPVAYPVVTHSLREPTKANPNYRATTKIVWPVMEVATAATYEGITPAPKKAYDLTFVVDVILPERSTLAQRHDLLTVARNVVANAIVTNAVEGLEQLY